MATSRTGTASHKNWRIRVLRQAQSEGVTNCPSCAVELDFDEGKKPNSAEPDHILPVAYGGTNTIDNGRVLCRRCNQSRGKGDRDDRPPPPPVVSSPIW